MAVKLVDSSIIADTYPVKGETVALWIPLSLALAGTILSVLIAQSLLSQKETEPPAFNELNDSNPVAVITDTENVQTSAPTGTDSIKSNQTVDCPPLFSFTFPKNSETPLDHHLTPQITRLNHWLKQHPDKKVYIEGHTDSSGAEEYNLLLSYRRAKTIEKIMIETGIPKNHLITRALGELEPLENQPAESEKNRRTSIRVEDLEECINPMINGESN